MKVAIVCGAPSSEMEAPFNDINFEIWVLGNRAHRYTERRISRIFEIHDNLTEHGDPVKYARYLVDKKIPMIVGQDFPVKANHVTNFDFEAAKKLFGSTYLTSSTAFMVAQALMEGATYIGIYGTDMAVDDHEYFWQRPCLEAWIGFARAKGVEVYIPPISPLGRCDYIEGRGCGGRPDFSLPPFTQAELLKMADIHKRQKQKIEDQINELRAGYQGHDGAQQAYERLAKVARAVEAGNKIDNLTDSFAVR